MIIYATKTDSEKWHLVNSKFELEQDKSETDNSLIFVLL